MLLVFANLQSLVSEKGRLPKELISKKGWELLFQRHMNL